MTWLLLGTALASTGTGIDLVENFFGATNINAVTGHGGMTAGISDRGDLTVLSWPSPFLNDQLAYATSNALDARLQPRLGAPEGAGLFLGLLLEDGDGTTLTWLRDTDWTVTQDYGADDGPNPHTLFVHPFGVSVEIIDAIDPDRATLVRQATVTLDETATVTGAKLVTYANLSPLPENASVDELPVVDWAMDGRNDFAAIWDAQTRTVVHFHPADQRVVETLTDLLIGPTVAWGPIGDAMTAGTPTDAAVAALLETADADYGAGAWLALTTEPAPTAHQVGMDDTDWCGQADLLIDNLQALPGTFEGLELPLEAGALDVLRCADATPVAEQEGWTHQPTDPLTDLSDLALEGSSLAAGEVASALITPLTFDADGQAQAAVMLGAGSNLRAAQRAVDADPSEVIADASAALTAWLADKYVPGEPGSRIHQVARRALINIRLGTDPSTGAIVASPSRQPAYGLDWPRDGAFFNVLLDIAGDPALVERRLELYADWQRDEAVEPTPVIDPEPPPDPTTGSTATYPADAWEMNYFPDGRPGGNLRFEIDTTAFAVWTIVAHVGWADDPTAHITAHWDTISRGADLLARWKDDETGLQAPAQEDDNAAYTATLHGAVTVLGALDLAERAGRLIGEDTTTWQDRATELRDAILLHLYSEEAGRFVQESTRAPFDASERTPTGPTAWTVWPMPLLPLTDLRMQHQLLFDLAQVDETVRLRNEGGAYFLKNVVAAAVAQYYPDYLIGLLGIIAEQSTEGTNHFGEVMINVDGRAEQRVANPHLWEGALFYLAATALEDPYALTAWDAILPPSVLGVPPYGVKFSEEKPCGCTIGPASSTATWALLALGLGWRRRPLSRSAAEASSDFSPSAPFKP